MMKNVAIIGAGSHGRGIREIIERLPDFKFYGYLDDSSFDNDVIGTIDQKLPYGVSYVLGINNSETRKRVLPRIHPSNKLSQPLIHPTATIGFDCQLGNGVVVQAGVILTTDVTIGNNTHINVGSTISQGSVIGEQVTISPGVHIAGEVMIGDNVQIGTGALIINLVKICTGVIIGAGGVVVKDITAPGTYVGVPIRKVK